MILAAGRPAAEATMPTIRADLPLPKLPALAQSVGWVHGTRHERTARLHD
jgi:hypothetical protein